MDAAQGDEGIEDFLDVGLAGACEGLGEGFGGDGGVGGSEALARDQRSMKASAGVGVLMGGGGF